jgi:hypothetical protein
VDEPNLQVFQLLEVVALDNDRQELENVRFVGDWTSGSEVLNTLADIKVVDEAGKLNYLGWEGFVIKTPTGDQTVRQLTKCLVEATQFCLVDSAGETVLIERCSMMLDDEDEIAKLPLRELDTNGRQRLNCTENVVIALNYSDPNCFNTSIGRGAPHCRVQSF